MEKVRVYELAKELNTTSKRLMEKLGEINIEVKNHMSLLEDHELDSLYKHIGVIKHNDKKDEPEEKKAVPAAPVSPKPEQKKDTKSAPRIIRTTEIIINSKDEGKATSQQTRNDFSRGDVRGSKGGSRNEFVRSSDSNSGLRAGFVRDNRSDYMNRVQKTDQRKSTQNLSETNMLKPAVNEPIKAPPIMTHDAVMDNKENTKLLNIETTKSEITNEMQKENTATVIVKKEEKLSMHDETLKTTDLNEANNEKQNSENSYQDKQAGAVNQESNAAPNEAAAESSSQSSDQQGERTCLL